MDRHDVRPFVGHRWLLVWVALLVALGGGLVAMPSLASAATLRSSWDRVGIQSVSSAYKHFNMVVHAYDVDATESATFTFTGSKKACRFMVRLVGGGKWHRVDFRTFQKYVGRRRGCPGDVGYQRFKNQDGTSYTWANWVEADRFAE